MKKIAVLGSTGSIGTQTLDIIRANGDKLKVHSLVAYSDRAKLDSQCKEFAPEFDGLISEGKECLIQAVRGADVAVIATRGIAALESILFCLDNGIDVALANKEALVCAGELIMSKAGENGIRPIDSEHCAISQCLSGHSPSSLSRILLTASGGPFRNTPRNELPSVTCEQALRHPNWHMGSKITVDSATMMNKSLEVIEASFLFGVSADRIQIVVHPQSVVHSMVEYSNGEIVAQLAYPDMRLPIQIALLGDEGGYCCKPLDLRSMSGLTFEQCDFDKFPCARLGYDILRYPSLCRTVMNAANDVCVERFLRGKFSFVNFHNIIMNAVEYFCEEAARAELTVENIRNFDKSTRLYVNRLIDGE